MYYFTLINKAFNFKNMKMRILAAFLFTTFFFINGIAQRKPVKKLPGKTQQKAVKKPVSTIVVQPLSSIEKLVDNDDDEFIQKNILLIKIS